MHAHVHIEICVHICLSDISELVVALFMGRFKAFVMFQDSILVRGPAVVDLVNMVIDSRSIGWSLGMLPEYGPELPIWFSTPERCQFQKSQWDPLGSPGPGMYIYITRATEDSKIPGPSIPTDLTKSDLGHTTSRLESFRKMLRAVCDLTMWWRKPAAIWLGMVNTWFWFP